MRAASIFVPGVVVLAACNETRGTDIVGTQSIAVTLVAPADPGSIDNRLPDTARTVTIEVEARDEQNLLDEEFADTLRVYAQFLGTLTPDFGAPDSDLLAVISTSGGRGTATFDLPDVFGGTVLWVDNGTGVGPNYVHGSIAGTSETIWFRDPFIVDLQTPEDEMAVNALLGGPLTDKQITIGGQPGTPNAMRVSRYGARGRLVISSSFAQGYTVSDVECADDLGTPPCTYQAYDHVMVFTFSAPRTECGVAQVGQVITGFTGGLSEFNNLTEIGFPRTFAECTTSGDPIVDVNRLPPPVVLDADDTDGDGTWFDGLSDPEGMINFERNEASPIQVNDAIVCDLDEDFDNFKQWKIDPTPGATGGDCSNNNDVINVITTGINGIDPVALRGMRLPRVVGVLRPVFNNWIIHPRSIADVTLPP